MTSALQPKQKLYSRDELNTPEKRLRIAVIGSGISGNLVARLLSSKHYVTVYESRSYIGGHCNTVDVELSGQQFNVDTGFMVFNNKTYPNFSKMLHLLDVETQDSDMSFSVRCASTGLEYEGSSLNGLFAQRRNIMRPRFYQMLGDILRFNRQSPEVLETDQDISLGDYLQKSRYSRVFVDNYLLPMTGAIWSCQPKKVLDFPAQFLVSFFKNHGLIQIFDRPIWKTIIGGARNYVHMLMSPLHDQIHLNNPVRRVVRNDDHVIVSSENHVPEIFDRVVFATHADQTLKILSDADSLECQILSSFPYHKNEAVLHTDVSLLPRRKNAWASWNYHIRATGDQHASVTYDLSRLQNHESSVPILLTLNNTDLIDPAKIIDQFIYYHPAYTHVSFVAQKRHKELNGHRLCYYCGAYWGYGFHEDGVNSALKVADIFGIGLNACTAASMKDRSAITATLR